MAHFYCIMMHYFFAQMTALHLAAQDGNTDAVSHLLSGGANVDARNARGQAALHLAALAQSPETVEVILKEGKETHNRNYCIFPPQCHNNK